MCQAIVLNAAVVTERYNILCDNEKGMPCRWFRPDLVAGGLPVHSLVCARITESVPCGVWYSRRTQMTCSEREIKYADVGEYRSSHRLAGCFKRLGWGQPCLDCVT